jgi:hypothetical protein
MLQNIQLALAGVIAFIALIHVVPMINPITVLTVIWIAALCHGLIVATNIVMVGGFPLLWYFTKLSFTDNV